MERDFTVLFRVRPSFTQSQAEAESKPLIQAVDADTTSADNDQRCNVTLREPRRTSLVSSTEVIEHHFASHHCYLASATSRDLFDAHIAPLIPFVLAGGYATVLAYGQTGSGKTHTLSECSRLAISALFASNADQCHMSVSAIEVYAKSKVNDLLDPANTHVLIGETIGGASTVARATVQEDVPSAEAMLGHVESAWAQRITRGTEKNPHSSRSHALIRISCHNKRDQNATPGVLQLVDLAGSERAADHSASSSAPNSAERKAETVAINTSLMTLKSCIRARTAPCNTSSSSTRAPPHIPFRSSKLTLALKEAFDLYSRQPTHTLFIATASPDAVDVAATLNTFRYASALVTSPHSRIELQPDAQGRNVFFWTPSRLAEWLVKYGAPLVDQHNVQRVLDGMDGARFARLPEGEFYHRLEKHAAKEGTWGNKQQALAKELHLKWWKLVIASRTLSQKALEAQWKHRQADKHQQEQHELANDAEVQHLLKLPSIAAS